MLKKERLEKKSFFVHPVIFELTKKTKINL